MQTNFSLAQLADPDIAVAERYPARLRALRLLPGDLPDLCAARRRARFAARPHLPDQGDAGARCAGDRGGRHAHRPLPVVPRLHDDLPLGRALHASGRSRPRAYRGDLPAAAARPADAAVPRPRDAVSAQASRGDDGGRARQAVRAAARRARVEAARRRGSARAAPRAGRHDRARRLSRRAARAGRGWRCSPAAPTRRWRRRSRRPPSACSTATASRWWSRRTRAAAARSSITWAGRRAPSPRRAPTSMPGPARSKARGSTPSSSPSRAAAPP